MATINLTKGQNINLGKEHPTIKKAVIGLGWDPQTVPGGHEFDLDASCFVLGADGKVLDAKSLIYFNNKKGFNDAIIHHGDNLTGGGDGDDEQITVNLETLPAEVRNVTFVVNIFDSKNRGGQNFGQVKNAYARIMDESGTELAKADLTEDLSGADGVIMAELYRKDDGAWKFKSIMTPANGGLTAMAPMFGMN